MGLQDYIKGQLDSLNSSHKSDMSELKTGLEARMYTLENTVNERTNSLGRTIRVTTTVYAVVTSLALAISSFYINRTASELKDDLKEYKELTKNTIAFLDRKYDEQFSIIRRDLELKDRALEDQRRRTDYLFKRSKLE